MDDKFKFKPLKRSNRGRKSNICDENFLKLIEKHHVFFLQLGKMPSMNHKVITEFAQELNVSQKTVYLKIQKYLQRMVFSLSKIERNIIDHDSDCENSVKNQTVNQLIETDPIVSLKTACYTAPYSDFIKSLKVYPDFVSLYYSDTQLAWYKKCMNMEYSCITIDVSGGILDLKKGFN